MAALTDQDRFNAAVTVINQLPKEGPFKPSDDTRLQFYAYYKQATLGPCTTSQPPIHELVNRAKWSAWKALAEMSKDDAMRNYVDYLKQTAATMQLEPAVLDSLKQSGIM